MYLFLTGSSRDRKRLDDFLNRAEFIKVIPSLGPHEFIYVKGNGHVGSAGNGNVSAEQ